MSSQTSVSPSQQAGAGPQQKAQEVAGQAQEKAQEAATQAKSRASEQVEQRSTELGKQASTAAEDLRGVAEHLRSQGKDQPAQAAEKVAERVEGAGSYLQRSDGERILSDVEDFGRQRPSAVVVGGLFLGFAASRFLKASSAKRYQAQGSAGTPTSAGSRPPVGRSASPPAVPVGRPPRL